MFDEPSRGSTIFTGVAFAAAGDGPVGPVGPGGSASGDSFVTTVRTPRFTWTWPRNSFVYAFCTRTTSPLAGPNGSRSHAVKGTVPVGSPRMPYRIVRAPASASICFSFTLTIRQSRFTDGSPGPSSAIVLGTPTEIGRAHV